jgi:RHS repeat-associated protein
MPDTTTVWPAAMSDVWHAPDDRQALPTPNAWLGSLVADGKDGTGTLYRRNRYYDPTSGRFTQQDPIGLAGGLNLYGYGEGDPINNSDPFGLCPWCIVGGAIGAVVGGGGKALHNYLNDKPLGEGVAAFALGGAIAGATLGFGAELAVAGSAAGATATGTAVGPGTLKLIDALEKAGPAMEARIGAVSSWLPAGQKAIQTTLEGGARMLSGGAGERARQVILNTDGSTVIKAFNVQKEIYEVVKTIPAPR